MFHTLEEYLKNYSLHACSAYRNRKIRRTVSVHPNIYGIMDYFEGLFVSNYDELSTNMKKRFICERNHRLFMIDDWSRIFCEVIKNRKKYLKKIAKINSNMFLKAKCVKKYQGVYTAEEKLYRLKWNWESHFPQK